MELQLGRRMAHHELWATVQDRLTLGVIPIRNAVAHFQHCVSLGDIGRALIWIDYEGFSRDGGSFLSDTGSAPGVRRHLFLGLGESRQEGSDSPVRVLEG